MKRRVWQPLPPTLLLCALVGQGLLHWLLPIADFGGSWWNLVGVGLVLAGIGLMVVADRQFERARTPVHPFHLPTALVTTGAFSVTRNPMYVGMLGVLAGVAMILGSLGPLATLPPFVGVLRTRFVRAEEEALARQFGHAYDDYARRVPRWLGLFRE